MPRTKVSRNVASKRIRSSTSEQRLNNQLRDLDEMEEHFLEELECRKQAYLDQITEMVESAQTSTPQWLLRMTWGEVQKMLASGQPLITVTGPNASASLDLVHSVARLNVNNMRRNGSSKGSSTDEGYRTDSNNKTAFDSDSEVLATALAVPRAPGPLESAKRRRRSKSVELNSQKAPSRPQSSHYSGLQHLGHASRSKVRTPLMMMNRHPKSNSSDRAYNVITPKVQPNTPLMIMRHARVGEQIFSLSGSPVVTFNRFAENTANVNIPMEDDILSIRPIEMASVDPAMLERMRPETFEHLKHLKRNLDVIMRVAEQKWGHE